MCGIAGQVRADGAPVSHQMLNAMCALIEHRGPDSRGIHVDGPVGLGIQRLRVIDLETGDQPIFNEDRSIAVVLNGEIYNFRELREQLIRSGHTFRTKCDTEVIVHLYEERGPRCVEALSGMFAFALWDGRQRQLLLARDRVGKKPLFYSHRNGTLSFSSELRSVMADPEIPRELDHEALDCYYAYQYVPAPLSVFRAVSKLPPATTLVWNDGGIQLNRYWRLDYSAKRSGDPRELAEELRAQIRAAVRRRMIADVPLGAFLSGGVDSSAVVAAMAEQSSQPVKTFSIGFDVEAFNELKYARQVAELLSTDHHEYTVHPSAIDLLPQIVRQYGEPFADSSAIPSFYLAELARRHVTVALNGDGGDESFAGYNRYVSNNIAARLERRLPASGRRLLSAIGDRLPTNADERSTLNRVRRLSRSLSVDAPTRYTRNVSFFDQAARDQLYTSEYRALVASSPAADMIRDPWLAASGTSPVDILVEVDVETYLPGDLLVKMDIATMAYSLEARSPLLDHELMEFAASVPARLKLRGLERKVLLRRAVREWLPDEILDRPKMGFGVPLPAWFRGELRGYVTDVLLDPGTLGRGYFREEYIRSLIDRHVSGTEDCSPRLWALLVGELWHREFVDRPASAGLDWSVSTVR
jgi:asparagine synthase (glutamine-hydrolysing)